MEIFFKNILVAIAQVSTSVKSHQIEPLKSVHFISCKSNVNKI